MGNIQILDPHLANLVAAGEVVDRPASAIKEMMENSIDAGATDITVEIKNGGSSFMRVTDNGCGMDRSDALACLSRHATSKLRQMSDLSNIVTLGFRGEALAAIASVSEFRIMTRRAADDMGTLVECQNGKIERCDAIGCPVGTTIIAEALFANVPARRKFLKKDLTETGAVVAVVEKVALSHPNIAIRLITDEKLRFATEGNGKLLHTIHAVLGRDFAKKLAIVDDTVEGIRVWGYVGRPDNVRGNRNQQNFFLNGRYVKSATATAALEQAFHSYCPAERYPCCVLHLEIHPAMVDVNVHPAKLEVKFVSEKAVFYAIYCAVRNSLNHALTPPGTSAPTRVTSDNLKSLEDQATFKAQTAEEALRISKEQEAKRGGFTQISAFESASQAAPPAEQKAAEKAAEARPDRLPDKQAEGSAPLSPAQPPQEPAHTPEKLIAVPLVEKIPLSDGQYRQVGIGYRLADDEDSNSYDPYSALIQEEKQRAQAEAASADSATAASASADATVAANEASEPTAQPKAPIADAPASDDLAPLDLSALLQGAFSFASTEGEADTAPQASDAPSAPIAEAADISADGFVAETADAPASRILPLPDYKIGGILFQCYVMVEVGNRLMLIDKHAAHERILYEQLKENMQKSDGFSQILLLPIPIAPTPLEFAAALEFAPEIHAIGFDFVSNEDAQTLELTQIPSEIPSATAADSFLTLLGHLASGTSVAKVSRQTLCEAALFQASCKAAVKAGREDDPGHIRWIVEQVLTRDDIRFCPHGRPVALEMTKSEMEHLFHRP